MILFLLTLDGTLWAVCDSCFSCFVSFVSSQEKRLHMSRRNSQRRLCEEPQLNEQTATAMHTSCAAAVAEGELIIIKPSGSVGLSTTSQTLAGSRYMKIAANLCFWAANKTLFFADAQQLSQHYKTKKMFFLSFTRAHTGRLPNCSVLTFFSTPQLLPNLRPSLSLWPATHRPIRWDAFSTRRDRQAGRPALGKRSTGGIFHFETETAVNNRSTVAPPK